MYQSLKSKVSNSLAFTPTHLISWRHIMLILLRIIISITSIDFLIRDLIFQVLRRILFLWTNLFTYIHLERCEDPYSFNIKSRRRCSGCNSFDTVLELCVLFLDNDLTWTQYPYLSISIIDLTKFYTTIDYLTQSLSFIWTWDELHINIGGVNQLKLQQL